MEVKLVNKSMGDAKKSAKLRGRTFESRCKCLCGHCRKCKAREKMRRWKLTRYRALARYGLLPEQRLRAKG
jgi:hypothetical protein